MSLETLRALEHLRQRLNTLAAQLGSLRQNLDSSELLPSWYVPGALGNTDMVTLLTDEGHRYKTRRTFCRRILSRYKPRFHPPNHSLDLRTPTHRHHFLAEYMKIY